MSCKNYLNHAQTNATVCLFCEHDTLIEIVRDLKSIKAMLAELLYNKVEEGEK